MITHAAFPKTLLYCFIGPLLRRPFFQLIKERQFSKTQGLYVLHMKTAAHVCLLRTYHSQERKLLANSITYRCEMRDLVQ